MTEPLPEPRCRFGYTMSQVDVIVTPGRLDEFYQFMAGQTMALCMGPRDVGDDRCLVTHGPVVYPWDLERFLQGKPVID